MKNKKEEPPVVPSKDVVIGNPEGPVSIVMFGDYECAPCSSASDAILKLMDEHPTQISFVYRHFPLTRVHQKAHKAAEAAIGAAQEGLFLQMHQQLFRNRNNLGTISLKSHAREAGVKDKKFLDKLINSTWGWFVQDDIRDGLDLGVQEIPAVFINGKRFEKSPDYKNLKAHIQQLSVESAPVKRKRA
jgi:protein-disulfide isomerase